MNNIFGFNNIIFFFVVIFFSYSQAPLKIYLCHLRHVLNERVLEIFFIDMSNAAALFIHEYIHQSHMKPNRHCQSQNIGYKKTRVEGNLLALNAIALLKTSVD